MLTKKNVTSYWYVRFPTAVKIIWDDGVFSLSVSMVEANLVSVAASASMNAQNCRSDGWIDVVTSVT